MRIKGKDWDELDVSENIKVLVDNTSTIIAYKNEPELSGIELNDSEVMELIKALSIWLAIKG